MDQPTSSRKKHRKENQLGLATQLLRESQNHFEDDGGSFEVGPALERGSAASAATPSSRHRQTAAAAPSSSSMQRAEDLRRSAIHASALNAATHPAQRASAPQPCVSGAPQAGAGSVAHRCGHSSGSNSSGIATSSGGGTESSSAGTASNCGSSLTAQLISDAQAMCQQVEALKHQRHQRQRQQQQQAKLSQPPAVAAAAIPDHEHGAGGSSVLRPVLQNTLQPRACIGSAAGPVPDPAAAEAAAEAVTAGTRPANDVDVLPPLPCTGVGGEAPLGTPAPPAAPPSSAAVAGTTVPSSAGEAGLLSGWSPEPDASLLAAIASCERRAVGQVATAARRPSPQAQPPPVAPEVTSIASAADQPSDDAPTALRRISMPPATEPKPTARRPESTAKKTGFALSSPDSDFLASLDRICGSNGGCMIPATFNTAATAAVGVDNPPTVQGPAAGSAAQQDVVPDSNGGNGGGASAGVQQPAARRGSPLPVRAIEFTPDRHASGAGSWGALPVVSRSGPSAAHSAQQQLGRSSVGPSPLGPPRSALAAIMSSTGPTAASAGYGGLVRGGGSYAALAGPATGAAGVSGGDGGVYRGPPVGSHQPLPAGHWGGRAGGRDGGRNGSRNRVASGTVGPGPGGVPPTHAAAGGAAAGAVPGALPAVGGGVPMPPPGSRPQPPPVGGPAAGPAPWGGGPQPNQGHGQQQQWQRPPQPLQQQEQHPLPWQQRPPTTSAAAAVPAVQRPTPWQGWQQPPPGPPPVAAASAMPAATSTHAPQVCVQQQAAGGGPGAVRQTGQLPGGQQAAAPQAPGQAPPLLLPIKQEPGGVAVKHERLSPAKRGQLLPQPQRQLQQQQQLPLERQEQGFGHAPDAKRQKLLEGAAGHPTAMAGADGAAPAAAIKADEPSAATNRAAVGGSVGVGPSAGGEGSSSSDDDDDDDGKQEDRRSSPFACSQPAAIICERRLLRRLQRTAARSQMQQASQQQNASPGGGGSGVLSVPAAGSSPAAASIGPTPATGDGTSAAGAGSAAAACAAAAPVHPYVNKWMQEPLERRLQVSTYLGDRFAAAYKKAGFGGKLYRWQADCLCQDHVLQGKNLVYCAPTSGGKSLVAEVLMLRRLQKTRRPAMLVLPYVALCVEKAKHLEELLKPFEDLEVRHCYGGQGGAAVINERTGVVVCTIEKANALVNRWLEEQTLDLIGTVVVDELHMVGDDDRGYLLELMLTKLRYATAASDPELDPEATMEGLQIIGMSATLPPASADAVARWLNARLHQTDFRPVSLQRAIKVGTQLQDSNGAVVRELGCDAAWTKRDPDHVAWLTRETVQEGASVLIFCGARRDCVFEAKKIAELVEVPERQPPPGQEAPGRAALLADLKSMQGMHLADLVFVFARGVAFHHAGLPEEARSLVEAAYRTGAVSVLTATTTLAAGVNLPARRVIIRHAYSGHPSNVLDTTKFHQMCGRAGRAGHDTRGEAVLLQCKGVGQDKLMELMTGSASPIVSCLVAEKRGMQRAVLEAVAAGALTTANHALHFSQCTLLWALKDVASVQNAFSEGLQWLKARDMIVIRDSKAEPTALGRATMASGLPPEEALKVKEDIGRARECLFTRSDLHLTYLVTPVNETIVVDWKEYVEVIFKRLEPDDQVVAERVGVQERGLRDCQTFSSNKSRNPEREERMRVARRFYAALIVRDLIQEVPKEQVMAKYKVKSEEVSALQERTGKFSQMVAAFCERLGWWDIEALVAKYQARVALGVRHEIVELTQIGGIKGQRARLLYSKGYRTPEAVAAMEQGILAELLLEGSGVQGGAKGATKQQLGVAKGNAAMIIKSAKALLSHKAAELKQQAELALNIVHANMADEEEEEGGAPDAQQQQQQQRRRRRQNASGEDGGTAENEDALTTPVAGPPKQQHQRQPPSGGDGGGGSAGVGSGPAAARPAGNGQAQGEGVVGPASGEGSGGRGRPSPARPAAASGSGSGSRGGAAAGAHLAAVAPHPAGPSEDYSCAVAASAAPPQSAADVPQPALAAALVSTSKPPAAVAPPVAAAAAAMVTAAVAGVAAMQGGGAAAAAVPVMSASVTGAGPTIRGNAAEPLPVPGFASEIESSSAAAGQQLREVPKDGTLVLTLEEVPLFCQHWGMAASSAFALHLEEEGDASTSRSAGGSTGCGAGAGDSGRHAMVINKRVVDVGIPSTPGASPLGNSPPEEPGGPQTLSPASAAAAAAMAPICRVKGLAVTWEGAPVMYVSLESAPQRQLWPLLAQVLGQDRGEKVTWDYKQQLMALRHAPHGSQLDACHPGGTVIDVRIALFVANPDAAIGKGHHEPGARGQVTAVAGDLLGQQQVQQLLHQRSRGPGGRPVRLPHGAEGCCRTAGLLLPMLNYRLRGDLQVLRLWQPLVKQEMPLVGVLVDMEVAGMALDLAALEKQRPLLKKRLKELEHAAHASVAATLGRSAPRFFQLSAPAEIRTVLFTNLRLQPPPCAGQPGKRGLSTRDEVLEELEGQHDVIPLIREHRKLSTLRDRFMNQLDALAGLPTSAKRRRTSLDRATNAEGRQLLRIRGRFLQTTSATGRLAMDEPNLQCMPKPFSFEVQRSQQSGSQQEEHQKGGGGTSSGGGGSLIQCSCNIRAAFVAPPGFVLLSADYGQIELRLMAHFSGDPGLLHMFKEDKSDPFVSLAALWLQLAPDQVTQEQRSNAKQLAYGILYGMGLAKLAESLGCDVPTAGRWRENFLASMPGVRDWLERVRASCRHNGGVVRTLGGRIRILEGTGSARNEARAAADRKAVNTVCQGSAADLVKVAMVRLQAELAMTEGSGNGGGRSGGGGGGGGSALPPGACRMLLQIHDELLFEVRAEHLAAAAGLVRAVMESAAQLLVPLKVKLHAGTSWGELEPLE